MTNATEKENEQEQAAPTRAPLAPMPREKPRDEGDFADEAGPRETEFGTRESTEAVVSEDFDAR